MRTPVYDFVRDYADGSTVRLHMPGHKGTGDIERYDITEISGADSLYEADGIIKESEGYASEIFGAHTFYSAEGSSLAIRAMLYLAQKERGARSPVILAARNAHRAFISGAALLGIDVEWIGEGDSYMSAHVTPDALAARLSVMEQLPMALYLTSPDYLGNEADIPALSEVCKRYSILLLVDNAHGAYLKFLNPSRHPIDLGADMCTDSAHKTLPVLTGGAYLHISRGLPREYRDGAKPALSLFGSSSPSYLILASLDKVNPYLAKGFTKDLSTFVDKIKGVKQKLSALGYTVVGDEELKISIEASRYGYSGEELASFLREGGIEPEMAERDFIVFMLSPADGKAPLRLLAALEEIPQKRPLPARPRVVGARAVKSLRAAVLSASEVLPTRECVGRVLALSDLSCPPAVPILMPGEVIEAEHIPTFLYYGKDMLTVIKE